MSREPFVHAVPDPQQRREIAQAVADGIPAEQLAETFNIALSTVHAYSREFAGTQRRTAALTYDDREQIVAGVRRGAKARYIRQFGRNVVDQVLLEAGIDPATT